MEAYWSYQLTISYDAHTVPVRSTVTEREAREGILRDIGGEWNERSLVITKNGHVHEHACIYT